MEIDKEKLKREGTFLIGAGKHAVLMTAPIHVGAAMYHIAQQPEIGTTIGTYATVPWVAGYGIYHYVKGRKSKNK